MPATTCRCSTRSSLPLPAASFATATWRCLAVMSPVEVMNWWAFQTHHPGHSPSDEDLKSGTAGFPKFGYPQMDGFYHGKSH